MVEPLELTSLADLTITLGNLDLLASMQIIMTRSEKSVIWSRWAFYHSLGLMLDEAKLRHFCACHASLDQTL